MKIGFLFAGQGAQYVGMGKGLYDNCPEVKEMYDTVKMDFDIKEVCFNGPEEKLNDTAYTQSAVLLTSMAIAEMLKEKGVMPSYTAGLSLGEYSALCFAGAFSLADALEIVRKRGLIMAEALPDGTSAMAAVMQADVQEIKEACKAVNETGDTCVIANYNSPAQIVISGTVSGVAKAAEILREKGVRRIIPLKVSGAFHSPLLAEASEKLEAVLKNYEIHKPSVPVVYNVSGREEDGDIISLLKKQIKSSVMFQQSVEYMISRGVDTFIEIGPGHTLSGFVKKISKDVKVYTAEHIQDIEKIAEELGNGK